MMHIEENEINELAEEAKVIFGNIKKVKSIAEYEQIIKDTGNGRIINLFDTFKNDRDYTMNYCMGFFRTFLTVYGTTHDVRDAIHKKLDFQTEKNVYCKGTK